MSEKFREITITEAREAFAEKRFTARELTAAYLSRICAVDAGPEGCNAISVLNPDALFLAEAADAARASGKQTGPLAGVPIVIKANINTGDKMPTTAGTEGLQDHYAGADSFVVRRLRAAGAVILGKTNMTEMANFMSYTMPGGYSSLGGQVHNFCCPGGEVGGSSSGSAVAMAADLACAALGTETNASIIWPAQDSGIVGLKPSIGLVSRTGVLPICSSLDTVGPMTKCVRDAAELLNVIAGYDPEDPATWVMQYREREDYTCELDPERLKGCRIGVNRAKSFRTDPEQQKATKQLMACMEQAGVEFVEGCDLEESQRVAAVEMMEFRNCLNAYFARTGSERHTLKEMMIYNERHEASALRYGQKRIGDAQYSCSGRMIEREYLEAMLEREAAAAKLQQLFREKKLDAILCTGGISNLAPYTGIPSMTIPIGRAANGMPIGCCFMGERFAEAHLLGILYGVEQLLKPPHD